MAGDHRFQAVAAWNVADRDTGHEGQLVSVGQDVQLGAWFPRSTGLGPVRSLPFSTRTVVVGPVEERPPCASEAGSRPGTHRQEMPPLSVPCLIALPMSDQQLFPAEPANLFEDGVGARTLSVPFPAGRLVNTDEGNDPPGLWSRCGRVVGRGSRRAPPVGTMAAAAGGPAR
jgi:hypothetical protein